MGGEDGPASGHSRVHSRGGGQHSEVAQATQAGGVGDEDAGGAAAGPDPECPERVRQSGLEPEHETHYVLVIHGTFDAPPADGLPTWYQRPLAGEQNFCSKLAKLLSRGPVTAAAVWRALPGEKPIEIPYPFHWDGSNTHQGRVDAATKLHRLVDFIAEQDPSARVHLVAHSHGGNVLLKTVDLYLRLLKKKQRRGEIFKNEAIKRKFWDSYGQPYERIRRWRKIEVHWIWTLFPFLIVWRGPEGLSVQQARVSPWGKSTLGKHVKLAATRGGLYPWAYYKWVDRFLGVGLVRQRMFLVERIVTSPVTNALGALVFLGTPFYVKKWHDWGLPLLALSTLCTMFLAYIVVVLYVFLWKTVFLASQGQRSFFDNSNTIPVIIGSIICIFVFASIVLHTSRSTVFRSGNLYHHARHGWSPAMSALVIHAGKLDEVRKLVQRLMRLKYASLALSTEPIIRAYVFPELTKLLKQTPWQPLPKRPSIYDNKREWFAFFFNYFMAFFWDVLFIIPALLMSALSYVLAPFITGIIQKIVVTISFGLAPGELNFAYVYVDEMLELPHVTQVVDHWNVQKLLAQAKTRSLQGLMLEGYEDDTVEQPEWVECPVGPTQMPRAGSVGSWANPSGPLLQTPSVRRRAAARQFRQNSLQRMESLAESEWSVGHTASITPSALDQESLKNAMRPATTGPELTGEAAIPSMPAPSRIPGILEQGQPETVPQDGTSSRDELCDGVVSSHEAIALPQCSTPPARVPVAMQRGTEVELKEASQDSGAVVGVRDGCNEKSELTPECVEWQAAIGAHKLRMSDTPWLQTQSEMGREEESPRGTCRPCSGGQTAEQGASMAIHPDGGNVPMSSTAHEKLVYEFLWNDAELELEALKSTTYRLLKNQEKHIDQNPRLNQKEFERQLKALCVMIEERIREVSGRLDLNHGAYFRDPRILRVIAHYITVRKIPQWALEIDADISKLDSHLTKIQSAGNVDQ